MKTAVEKRESEVRRGLNHMSEHLEKLQDRMAEMIQFFKHHYGDGQSRYPDGRRGNSGGAEQGGNFLLVVICE